MDFLRDPAAMTPGERLTELAAILALGYLRLRARPEIALPPDGAHRRLDSRGEQRPPCDAGLAPRDPVGEGVVA